MKIELDVNESSLNDTILNYLYIQTRTKYVPVNVKDKTIKLTFDEWRTQVFKKAIEAKRFGIEEL